MKRSCLGAALGALALSATVQAQTVPASAYAGLQWRCIGPHRGGRTVGADGDPNKPNVLYIGVNNGGVWKTTDYGRTWNPIFDSAPTGSVGCLAVAPSDPKTIYVGSGEGLQRPDLSVGDGIYKTTDGGKTWKNMGLSDGQQICQITVHPKDANKLFVAVLGHPYGPNETRGVFRSLDGGKTWKKVLYKDQDTGATAVLMDPKDPNTLYASLWQARQGPWENGQWQGPGSGLYKSTDFGNAWKPIMNGLPTFAQGLGRIGLAVSPSNPKVLYATVDSRQKGGIYRSEDAGARWVFRTGEARVWGRGSDFAEIDVDPRDPNIVYTSAIAMYKSTDGAKTFRAIKGAPGGDDYHTLWINPKNPDVMLTSADQGAVVTVNGGETWSSWYNQPTAQFYHVSTDNDVPYNVYGGQQESGSVGIASRGRDGQITFREWHPVGAGEYAYVAADPLDSNIVYGGGYGASVSKYDKRTGLVESLRPPGSHRALRTSPCLFSTVDPRVLFFGTECVFSTSDGGKTWKQLSPDLSRDKPDWVPESIGVYRTPEMSTMARRGVVYAIAPSKQTIDTVWAGTDDGLIHVTNDGGKTWANVTPPALKGWMKVSQLDAGSFDNGTCYAAIDAMRIDDWRPHIFITHDGGKSWAEKVNGIPANEVVRAVREDPVRKGLLYASTERTVYFSLDDGEHWNSLRQNLPGTSVRDIVVKGNDLVIGTHGRSFWILDDISPLRHIGLIDVRSSPLLYPPSPSYRIPWNLNTDTPLPPEEPGGKNPPDGAILYYGLAKDADKVELDILDSSGTVVRHYSSDDKPPVINESQLQIASYWIRPFQPLSKAAGMHRFVWDQHAGGGGEGGRGGYPMTAILNDTPAYPGPWVPAGTYTVRLTVDGKSQEKTLELRPDPRVKG
ncbi:MAG: glycoside hydrolase [Armatimonadetes bacterium]|nr:glycoside hydrolase [Armatimonadota bacterium]